MPLFSAAREKLEWADLEPLLSAQVPEHEMLEYKADVTKYPIEKTMAAMANTFGGDIIVGVKEERDGIPKPPGKLRGLEATEAEKLRHSIEERNWKIHPPILGLRVESVPIPSGVSGRGSAGRCVVVVRIPQSDLVPHFIPGMGHYGRAASHNRRMDDVDLSTDRIRWLDDRRSAHIRFRDGLLAWMDWLSRPVAWHTAWCVPQFPSPGRPVCELPSRHDVERTVPCLNVKGSALPFFLLDIADEPQRPRSVRHGWFYQADADPRCSIQGIERASLRGPSSTYLLEDRGLVASKAVAKGELAAILGKAEQEGTPAGVWFDWTIIAVHVLGVCMHADRLYRDHGYSGPVQLGLELAMSEHSSPYDVHLGCRQAQRYRGKVFALMPDFSWWPDGFPMAAPGRRLREERICLARDLPRVGREFVLDSPWARAFNVRLARQDVERMVAPIEEALAQDASRL